MPPIENHARAGSGGRDIGRSCDAQVPKPGGRRRAQIGTWFALALLLVLPLHGIAAGPAAGPRDRSTCVVQFGVRDDHFVVASIDLTPRGAYLTDFSPTSVDALKRELAAGIDAIVAFKLPLTAWVLPDRDIRAYVAADTHPAQPALAGAQDWGSASASLKQVPARVRTLQDLLTLVVTSDFFTRALVAHTPFRILENAPPDRTEELLSQGRIELRLLDPVSLDDVAAPAIRFAELTRALRQGEKTESRAEVDRQALASTLRSLVGRPWIRRDIQVRIADYYQGRGAPSVEPVHLARKLAEVDAQMFDPAQIEPPGQILQGLWEKKFLVSEYGLVQILFHDHPDRPSGRHILLTEPRYVSQISFVFPENHPAHLPGQLLYTLLDDADWRATRRIGIDGLLGESFPVAPGLIGYNVSIDSIRRNRPAYWPLFNQELQWRSGPLLPLGYSVGLESGHKRRSSLHLVPVPREQADATISSGPPAKPSPPEDDDDHQAHEADGDIAADPPANPRPLLEAQREKPRVVDKEFRHLAQFSAEYRPGQGTELRGSYRRSLLADRTGAATFELGALRQLLGGVDFKKDYVLFDRLGRRLALTLKGYSEFEPDAPAGAVVLNQRRSGARGEAELELWRARSGHWLTGRVEVQRDYVEIEPASGGTESNRYDSSVRLAATWFYKNPRHLGSPALTVDADVKLSRTHHLEFTTWSVQARQHRMIGAFLQADWHARFAGATESTPVLDRPRLGGTSSVRGYREDAAAGTGVVEARAEVWMPLRALESRWPKLGPAIRRQFVAAFIDAGRFRADDSAHNVAGAGLGVRLILAPGQIIKLDVARGLRDAGPVRAGTRVHVDVATEFPF